MIHTLTPESLKNRFDFYHKELYAIKKEIKRRIKAGDVIPGFSIKNTVHHYFRWPVKPAVIEYLKEQDRLDLLGSEIPEESVTEVLIREDIPANYPVEEE